jgi:hypothetical protein
MTRHVQASRRITSALLIPRWARWAPIVLCMALFLSACSDGGESNGSSGNSCSVPSSSPSATIATSSGYIWYGAWRWTVSVSNPNNAKVGVTITSAYLQALYPNNQILNDEEWMSDKAGSWIETGYGTFPNGSTQFFWGDNRTGVYTTWWSGPKNSAGVSASSVGTPNDFSIAHTGVNRFTIATAGWQGSSPSHLCATRYADQIGLEVDDSAGTVQSSPPSCGISTGFFAQSADFKNITQYAGTPPLPPSSGKARIAGTPIHAGWNGSIFKADCT